MCNVGPPCHNSIDVARLDLASETAYRSPGYPATSVRDHE
jgi:hypothetical protein